MFGRFTYLGPGIKDDIREVFVEVVRLYISLGIMGLEYIAFDGTKLNANASIRQVREEESLKKEIEKLLK